MEISNLPCKNKIKSSCAQKKTKQTQGHKKLLDPSFLKNACMMKQYKSTRQINTGFLKITLNLLFAVKASIEQHLNRGDHS